MKKHRLEIWGQIYPMKDEIREVRGSVDYLYRVQEAALKVAETHTAAIVALSGKVEALCKYMVVDVERVEEHFKARGKK